MSFFTMAMRSARSRVLVSIVTRLVFSRSTYLNRQVKPWYTVRPSRSEPNIPSLTSPYENIRPQGQYVMPHCTSTSITKTATLDHSSVPVCTAGGTPMGRARGDHRQTYTINLRAETCWLSQSEREAWNAPLMWSGFGIQGSTRNIHAAGAQSPEAMGVIRQRIRIALNHYTS